jgi:hypothetical protein
MRYQNNDRLRDYLGRGAAGAYREHLRHPSFELDDAAFAATLAEVLQTHPQMSRDDAEARAVFRLLTSGAPPAVAVALPSRWYRARAWARRAAPRAWWWLKLAWAVSLLILAAIAAHAEPDPQPANLVSATDTLRALEVHPPQLFQLGNAAARVQFLNSGAWSYVSSGNPFPITCVSGCSAAGAFADNSAFTVGATAITPIGGYYTTGADPSLSSGNAGRARIDAHSYLFVDCAVGCSGGSGGTSLVDEAAFTQGTTSFTPAGCFFNNAITNLTSGQGGSFECTNDRNLFVNLNRVGGSALALGQTTMASSVPVALASNQSALSVTATNAFALDSSVNGILNAQGSTTSGEKGPLVQCAVTTAAPTDTTAQTDPLSCDTSGLLRMSFKDTPSNTNNLNVNLAASGATVSVSPPANQSVNVNQVAGSAVSTAATGTELVGLADGAGNKLTSNSTTYTSKFGLDANLLGTLGTAFTTAGLVDIKGADGNVFVRQATAANLNATVVGGKTNNNAAPGATNVGVLPAIANGATQTWTEGDQVLESVDLSGRQRIVGITGDNGGAATTNRAPVLPGVYQTSYLNGTAATQGRDAAESVGTDGLLWTAQLPSIRPASYVAEASIAGSSTTDNAVLPGNASNTVLVTGVRVSCTQTTAGIVTLTLVKRSAADTSGTSASMTAVPDDSNYAGAASAPLSYTGTGPTVGTAVGNVDAYKLGCMATGTAAPNDIYILNRRQKPIVLRGTAQQLAVNMGGAITGGNLTITFEWMETATITP